MNRRVNPDKLRPGYDPRVRNVEPYAAGVVREESRQVLRRYEGYFDNLSDQILADLGQALKGQERMGKVAAEYINKRIGAVSERHLTVLDRATWHNNTTRLSRPSEFWRRYVCWRPSRLIRNSNTPEEFDEVAFNVNLVHSHVSRTHVTLLSSNLPISVTAHVLTRMVERYATRKAPLAMVGQVLPSLLGINSLLILMHRKLGINKVALPLQDGLMLGRVALVRSTYESGLFPYHTWRQCRSISQPRSALVVGSHFANPTAPVATALGQFGSKQGVAIGESGYYEVDPLFRRNDSKDHYHQSLGIKLTTFLPYDMLNDSQDWVVERYRRFSEDHAVALEYARELFMPDVWKHVNELPTNEQVNHMTQEMEQIVQDARWLRAVR